MTQQTESLEAALPRGRHLPPGAVRHWLPMRTLNASHSEEVCKHLLSLNTKDRVLRFAHAASDEQIRHYASQIDYSQDEVFGVFDRGLRLVAMAHLAFAQDGLAAEFGVSVLERVRGRGFGARLFEHAVMHARNRGVSTMVIYVARHNAPMLAILRRAGAELSYDGAEATGRLPMVADTLGTQVGALLERHAAEFDYQLKLHVHRLDRFWPLRGTPRAEHLDH
ncbi:MAG: GNAT family N-acetyltransferase [Rubrivivax sp.]|jgi:RimJ/RimL family protein N-acetyltransferase|nr:GNAT family N-acetyltransferase [Rubrivivax sp.]